MRTVLFLNAKSRKARKLIPQVLADFASPDSVFTVTDTIIIRKSSQFKAALRQLQEIPNKQYVIIGSGDGTVMTVLNSLKDQPAINYGFLPLGTGNDFAHNIGFPTSYTEAFAQLQKKKIRQITLGSVNDHLFANVITIGLPSRVAENISDKTKKYFGQAAYVLSGLRTLLTHKAMYCTLTTSEETHSFSTHTVVIANGRYQANRPISEEASFYKDQLVLIAFGLGQSRLQYIYSFLRFLINKHEDHRTTLVIPFTDARLECQPARKIDADGEITGLTPAQLEVKPSAISVFS